MGRKLTIDWDTVPLGSKPDTQIAQDLGCSSYAVWNARSQRGIPAAVSPEQRRPRRVGKGRPSNRFTPELQYAAYLDWRDNGTSMSVIRDRLSQAPHEVAVSRQRVDEAIKRMAAMEQMLEDEEVEAALARTVRLRPARAAQETGLSIALVRYYRLRSRMQAAAA